MAVIPSELLGCPARLNPLAVARTDCLPFQFAEGDWESHLHQLKRLDFRGAIVGPKGSGKTTLLEQLHARLIISEQCCFLHRVPRSIAEQATLLANVRQLPSGNILLLDSAEQLSRRNRNLLLREASQRNLGLVVTTHRSEFLPTWIECRTNLKLLHSLLRQLLDKENASSKAAAEASFRNHQGNIREVFRELYDQYATGQLV